jgi:hypothetical protein
MKIKNQVAIATAENLHRGDCNCLSKNKKIGYCSRKPYRKKGCLKLTQAIMPLLRFVGNPTAKRDVLKNNFLGLTRYVTEFFQGHSSVGSDLIIDFARRC